MNKIKSKMLLLWIAAFLGIVVGALIVNIYGRHDESIIEYMAIDNYMKWNNVEFNKLFLAVLVKRIKQYALIWFNMILFTPNIFLIILIFIVGVILGAVMAAETIRLGIKGIVLATISFLPHGLIYAIVVMLTEKTLKLWKESHEIYSSSNKRRRYIFFGAIVGLALIVLGSAVESYFSPIFLKNFFQYVVPY